MNQTERELFFEEHLQTTTLRNADRSVLYQLRSPQGNRKRSRVGEKWFYFGETTDSYSLFYDEIVGENKDNLFLHLYEDGKRIGDGLVAISKETFDQRYPVQTLFPEPMSEQAAKETLRQHFINQTERSTTIL